MVLNSQRQLVNVLVTLKKLSFSFCSGVSTAACLLQPHESVLACLAQVYLENVLLIDR